MTSFRRKRAKTVRMIVPMMLILMLICGSCAAETLRYGMSGAEVSELQQALIDQSYLSGKADGIFGNATENAVRAFQKKNGLVVDGLAGEKTQKLLYNRNETAKNSLFSGDYSTIRESSDKGRIKKLQQALIDLKYLKGNADGSYGSLTRNAVCSFQKNNKLKEDGLAGQKTLKAIESAKAEGRCAPEDDTDLSSLPDDAGRMEAPDKSSIQLLHWYDDIKPGLKTGAKMTVYDPSTGFGWTLKLYSKGRHCDCEPLTLTDTKIMLKAFGGKNTWNQKGVYVKLPDGRWTVGATHDMPHLKGSIRDNGFDGRLCVHFFRDMTECAEKDPNYGVSNQRTIRTLWRKVSGEIIND